MSRPPGELSGDTLMPPGAVRPELRPLSEEDVPRDWPTDAPGHHDGAGWVKADAYCDGQAMGGWNRIDDADPGDGGDHGMWRQT